MRWRPRLLPDYEIYGMPAEAVIDLKRRSAAGEADATFELYRLAVWCTDGTLISVRTTQVLAGRPLRPQSFTPRVRGGARPYECRSIEQNVELYKEALLDLAREQGATDLLLLEALEDFPSAAAVKSLERAWLAGDARAAALLARAYRSGWMDGDNPVLADDSVALAYDIIATELVPFVDEYGYSQQRYEAMVRETESYARGMPAHAIESSVETARVLLETNQNCCVVPDASFSPPEE